MTDWRSPKRWPGRCASCTRPTATALADTSFQFQLLLPADDHDGAALFARMDALAGWVNHFLLGLGVVQPQLDKVQGDVRKAIDDLRNIGQLEYDEDEDREELAQSLEEVIEYVRMATILCHNDLPARMTMRSQRRPLRYDIDDNAGSERCLGRGLRAEHFN